MQFRKTGTAIYGLEAIMTRKLKPCPFCGNESSPRLVTIEGKDGWRDRYFVLCDYEEGGCGAGGGYRHYKEDAIYAWNERKKI